MGIETGYDLQKLIEACWIAEEVVGHPLWGHVSKGGPRPRGEDRYPIDMPFVETLDEASHFLRGSEVYEGQIRPLDREQRSSHPIARPVTWDAGATRQRAMGGPCEISPDGIDFGVSMRLLKEVRDEAQLAESLGFDYVLTGEHLSFYGPTPQHLDLAVGRSGGDRAHQAAQRHRVGAAVPAGIAGQS